MIGDRSVLAVVPARGGSKGIPLKNLKTVGGRPLVALVGDVVRQVPEIDSAVLSTDHDEIARVGAAAGLKADFRRPPEISGDRIGDWAVLHHALLAAEALESRRYDIVVMLQPTSPLRRPADVSATIRTLVDGGYDSVWTVSETDSKAHPLKQLTVTDGRLDYYDSRGGNIVARQELQPVYHRNGVAYAITRECLVEQRTIKGCLSGACVIEGHQLSIDSEWDIALVEFVLSRRAEGNP